MSILSLLSTFRNDLYLDAVGNLAMDDGAQAVAACCRSAIQAQRGEMQFALTDGMPTTETAWDRYSPAQFEAAARAIIRGVPDVLEVVAFTIERAGEALRYTATIRTVYGETVING